MKFLRYILTAGLISIFFLQSGCNKKNKWKPVPFQIKKQEVLITGGDPLMSLPLLSFTLNQIKENAPNIKMFLGTFIPRYFLFISRKLILFFISFSDIKNAKITKPGNKYK